MVRGYPMTTPKDQELIRALFARLGTLDATPANARDLLALARIKRLGEWLHSGMLIPFEEAYQTRRDWETVAAMTATPRAVKRVLRFLDWWHSL